jgi:hypothetical protein
VGSEVLLGIRGQGVGNMNWGLQGVDEIPNQKMQGGIRQKQRGSD